jgi:hypothetical protein
LRDHHRTDRRCIGDRRAGNAAQERRGQHVDDRKTAAKPGETNEHVGKRDQAPRHSAFGHDRAREHEKRDRQHSHLADAVGDFQHQGFKRNADRERAGDRGHRQ